MAEADTRRPVRRLRAPLLLVAGALWLGEVLWPAPVLSHEIVSTTVTYDKEIVRILNKKCIACHSDANVAVPFTSYEQTRPWARAIEDEVLRRRMPPWRAVAGYGEFANNISLTTRELQSFVSWSEGNGPKSKDQQLIVNVDQVHTPEKDRLRPDFSRWQLGKPDISVPIPANAVATGGDQVCHVSVDAGLRTDQWIRALEFKPGDRRVVRAATFWLEETGQWLGSWTPWAGVTALPAATAYLIPAGSHIAFEIQYRGTSQPIDAHDTLGLYLAPTRPEHVPADLVLTSKVVEGSGKQERTLSASMVLASDTTVLALEPSTSQARSFEVRVKKPNGSVEILLLVRDNLPEWPTPYILATPKRLPKNSTLTFNVHLDDSTVAQAAAGPTTLTVSAYETGGARGPTR